MAIDKERLRRLHRESKALLESVADRLPPERLKEYRTFSFVGEWLLLVDSLCASLVKGRIAVTPSERDALASVLALFNRPRERYPYVNDPEGTLAALHVTGDSASHRT